jgi:hypothetical protein
MDKWVCVYCVGKECHLECDVEETDMPKKCPWGSIPNTGAKWKVIK